MIMKLKEREKQLLGSEGVTPALVMSDFGMAIIIVCL